MYLQTLYITWYLNKKKTYILFTLATGKNKIKLKQKQLEIILNKLLNCSCNVSK